MSHPEPPLPDPWPLAPGPGFEVVILADDLAGACDTAQPFAARTPTGVLVRGLDGLELATGWQALSVNGRTRPLDAAAAGAATRGILRDLGLATSGATPPAAARPTVIYKKLDSTLRGNVAAELAAVAAAFPDRPVIVAPAFPAMGRTAVGGRVLVRGVPVDQTEYAADPRHPVREASLLRLLEDIGGCRPELIALPRVRAGIADLADALQRVGGQARFLVLDAETDGDLEIIAQAAQATVPPPALLAGSAGLAGALARVWRGGPEEARGGPAWPPGRLLPGPSLVVIGTRNQATARQVEWIRRQGLAACIPIHPDHFLGHRHGAQAHTVCVHTRAALNARQDVVLHVAGGFVPELSAARLLADVAARLPAGAAQGLVLSGGGTAEAVLLRLGVWGIRLLGAPAAPPGCSLGLLCGGPHEGIPVILKAGGFGPETLLGDLLTSR